MPLWRVTLRSFVFATGPDHRKLVGRSRRVRLESYSPLSVVCDGSSQMSLKSDGVIKFINVDGVS